MSIFNKSNPATSYGVINGLFSSNSPEKDNPFITKEDLALVSDAVALKSDIAAGSSTGTVISFVSDTVFGTIPIPETGSFVLDYVGAKLGVTNLVIHNALVAPTFGVQFKQLSGSGSYVTGSINYIYMTYINSTKIIYSIQQEL